MNRLNQRLAFIDIAKGIGIICIAAGHVFPISMVNQWLYAFHVPVFFIISGFTYAPTSNWRKFLRRKFSRLMIPYYFFSVVSILVMALMARVISIDADTRILPNLLGMLYANSNSIYMEWNRPLWFLPCLFAALIGMELFETLIAGFVRPRACVCRCVFIALSWAGGMVLNTCVDVYLPLHLESAVFLTGFMEFGYMLRMFCARWENQEGNCRALPKKAWTAIPALLAAGVMASSFNGWTDISTHGLGRTAALLVVSSLSFSLAIFVISDMMGKCRWLEYLGRHSVAILVMHKFPVLFFKELIPGVKVLLADPKDPAGICCGLAITAASIGLCLLAEKVILWILPEVLGEKRNNTALSRAGQSA